MKTFARTLMLVLAIPLVGAFASAPAVATAAPESGTCDLTEPEPPESGCLTLCPACEAVGGICVHTSHGCFCE